MFFGGQLADRYFAQEKFLAFSHLIGGLAMLGLAYQKTFWPFFGLMLLHCFFYVPTMSVTNAIAFANLKDAQKDFGFIRVWGTIGWIAASWPFIFIPIDWAKVPVDGRGRRLHLLARERALGTLKTGPAMEAALTSTFIVAGIASLVLAAFCLILPHTPPAKSGRLGVRPASRRSSSWPCPSILVLFIVTFFDSLVHYCYFFWTSRYLPAIGLPGELDRAGDEHRPDRRDRDDGVASGFFLKRLGWRTTMIIGILGHVVRFGIYSIGTPRPALAGHPQQRRPRLRLRVLLRDGLHLRRRELPQGRPHQRPEPVQPADPGPRAARRQLPLGLARRRLLDDRASDRPGRNRSETIIDYHKLFLSRSAVGLLAAVDPGDLLPSQGQGPGTRRGPRPGKLIEGDDRSAIGVRSGPWWLDSGVLLVVAAAAAAQAAAERRRAVAAPDGRPHPDRRCDDRSGPPRGAGAGHGRDARSGGAVGDRPRGPPPSLGAGDRPARSVHPGESRTCP